MSLRRVLLPLLAALFALAVIGGATPAGAVDNPTYTAPPPATTITSPGPTTSVADDEVVTAVNVEAARTRLAITGSDATGLAVLGGALLLTGAGVLVLRRRAAAPTA